MANTKVKVMIISEKEQLRIVVAQYFKILKHIERECDTTPEQTVKVETLNKILYGNSQVDFWEAAKNLISPKTIETIEKMDFEFDDSEFKVCCLACSLADTKTMSVVLNVRKTTIYAIKSHIRRKLGYRVS